MNFDLALMALEGLTRAPLEVTRSKAGDMVVVRGSGPALRELARLCLLLGGDDTPEGEEIVLQSNLHLREGSFPVRLVRS